MRGAGSGPGVPRVPLYAAIMASSLCPLAGEEAPLRGALESPPHVLPGGLGPTRP